MIRIIIKIVMIMLGFMLILVGLGFFIGSLYLYLGTVFKDSTMATFFSGLTVLFVAIILLLITILLKKKSARPHLAQTISDISEQTEMVPDPIGLFKKYPLQTSLLGMAAGFVFGFSPKTRDLIIDTVMSYVHNFTSKKDNE